ncbi:MAG: Hsp20/alpha crystallin family protein [Acidobacteriota bacterium]
MGKKNYPFFEIEDKEEFPAGIRTNQDWEPFTNIYETDKFVIIEMELPGVPIDDISIVLTDNRQLIVKGVKEQPRYMDTGINYYLFERKFGSFQKKILIDFPIESEKIRSVMENGVLVIEIQKKLVEKISVKIK